jgi:hypothetical protein
MERVGRLLMKKQYGDLKGVDKAGLMKPLRGKISEAMDPLETKRLECDLAADPSPFPPEFSARIN